VGFGKSFSLYRLADVIEATPSGKRGQIHYRLTSEGKRKVEKSIENVGRCGSANTADPVPGKFLPVPPPFRAVGHGSSPTPNQAPEWEMIGQPG